ncbi:putative mucin/carbohydrate-binding domain-containing protein [unidentified bacterial endosymbiont]|uniref:putative mucin/carbohydrate-binding domain-containing protein n=1 Tax=unidentified bacterial endosymbiont TaxID=2355 RepID=UPI00209FC1D0|nr:putative mucin/carbohydrate-binding domain-containing protein [unidentified bacterial endosymbiont]
MGKIISRKSIYSLEKPVWLDKSGMSKGIRHDRQHLGIILHENTDLEIRQSNEAVTYSLKLRLLNDNSNTEKIISVGQEWITINNTVTSVPFIDTPYQKKQSAPTVEYRYPDGTKLLPVYRKLDNENYFFNLWDTQNSEFALIDSDYFLILVPQCNKNNLLEIKLEKKIDELITNYEKLILFYNELAGLSFYTDKIHNKNIPNRYFIKADQSSTDGAYYGGDHTAVSSNSIADFWIDDLEKKWGHLHEIAHGYQGKFMNGSFDVWEVWNNIYTASYQDIYLGKEVFKSGWLYGDSINLYKRIENYFKDNIPVNDWGVESKLYFMMLMKDKAGATAFSHFNQEFRKSCNQEKIFTEQLSLLDRLSDSYSKVGKIDVTPFVYRVGGMLSEKQRLMNMLNHGKAVYPFCELVNSDHFPSWQSQLNIKTPFELVDPLQLKETGLVGELAIHITIDSFKEIYEECLLLMEGENYAVKANITQPKIHLSNIPIGCYTLFLPTGKSKKYKIDTQYAIVKEGVNSLNVNYYEKKSSPILNQMFNFLGLSDNLFATLLLDFPRQKIIFNTLKGDPHSPKFNGRKYAEVIIKDAKGNQLFSKEMQGSGVAIDQYEIKFEIGYQIEIFHAEFQRLITNSDNLVVKQQDHLYTITPSGLQYQTTKNNPDSDLKKRIEVAAKELKRYPQWIKNNCNYLKDNIYLAIKNFNDTDQTALLEQYQSEIPKVNQVGPYVGDKFGIYFLGLGDWKFFTTLIDRGQNTITFTIPDKGNPHSYFKEISYAFVWYIDHMGVEKYRYNFIGDQVVEKQTVTFPLSSQGGERLFVHHKEAISKDPNDGSPPRYSVNNLMQGNLILAKERLMSVTYQFSHNGLTELSADSPEALQLPVADTAVFLAQSVAATLVNSEIHCSLDLLQSNRVLDNQLTLSSAGLTE